MKKLIITLVLALPLLFSSTRPSIAAVAGSGRWQLLQESIGISAMHMQLLNNDRVVVFDSTVFGPSRLALPAGRCRHDPVDTALKVDCTAHSTEYDVAANTFRPLMVQTDTWCSSGALMPDGTLAQTGGFNYGEKKIGVFKPCINKNKQCDWQEIHLGLAAKRWYATNHILPDGRQIVIRGIGEFNYEFYPKGNVNELYKLPFLQQTYEKRAQNNLYPFVFLCPDGNLFVFANNRAILLDYTKNKVVKAYPEIPGGEPRSYPSTGSAVLLPLKNIGAKNVEAEVLVCGGAPKESFAQMLKGKFAGALKTCARIKATDPKPEWIVEDMPRARVMGDMVMLPNGKVLIINGAAAGTAGWDSARVPVLNPDIYDPEEKIGARFETQNPTKIPRMYHSSAGLLRDGRVLVGGSNPHKRYNFKGVLYPTELSLEAFSPKYLDTKFGNVRPKIELPFSQAKFKYAQNVAVMFSVAGEQVGEPNSVKTTLVSPSFTTHSFSMNQRLLELPMGEVKYLGKKMYQVKVTMPGSANLAPPGYYMMFVVHKDVPSEGIWVQINKY